MGQPIARAVVLVAASGTAVCAAQTAGSAGPLSINGGNAAGGVATLPAARRIVVTSSSAADNGTLLTLLGTDRAGNSIGEALKLNSTTAPYSSQDFLTVSGVSVSAATTGTVSVGTNGVGSSGWVPVSYLTDPFNVGYAVNLGGVACNYTVESTVDAIDKAAIDSAPNGNHDSSGAGLATSTFVPPVAFPVLAGQTADVASQVIVPCRALRLTVNSGAVTAGVRFTVVQAGIVG